MSWESYEKSAEKGPMGFGIKVILSLFILVALVAILSSVLNLGIFKFFAPKYEQAKREVFQESKEYQHGTLQELDKMRLEYVKTSDPDIKGAIGARALRMTAEFDKANMPPDIRLWLAQLEQNQ